MAQQDAEGHEINLWMLDYLLAGNNPDPQLLEGLAVAVQQGLQASDEPLPPIVALRHALRWGGSAFRGFRVTSSLPYRISRSNAARVTRQQSTEHACFFF